MWLKNVGAPTKSLSLPIKIVRYYFNGELVQIIFMMIMMHRKSVPFFRFHWDLFPCELNIAKGIVSLTQPNLVYVQRSNEVLMTIKRPFCTSVKHMVTLYKITKGAAFLNSAVLYCYKINEVFMGTKGPLRFFKSCGHT